MLIEILDKIGRQIQIRGHQVTSSAEADNAKKFGTPVPP